MQPANTTDLWTALINLGLLASGGATPLDLNGGTLTIPTVTRSGELTISTSGGGNLLLSPGGTGVGIGVTPASILHTKTSSTHVASFETTGTGGTAHFVVPEATNNFSSFQFDTSPAAGASTNIISLVRGVITQADPSALIGDLRFWTNAGDSITEKWQMKGVGGHLLATTDGGPDISASSANRPNNIFLKGTLISAATGTIGWSVVAGASTACSTTCTNACVVGFDTGLDGSDLVDCADATADKCLRAGAN